MKWIDEHLTPLLPLLNSCCLTTLCMPVHFLNLSNQPLLASNSLTAALVPSIFFARSACNSLTFPQIIASETLSPANCCSLIHTNNNFSISLIVCDLCFVLFCNISFLDFFFLRQDGTDHWCGLPVHPGQIGHAYAYFATSSCLNSIVFLAFFITWNFLWPHVGLFTVYTGL